MEFDEAWNFACSSVGMACREGNYAALKHLIKSGKTVDVQDNRGWRPVHETADNNSIECLSLLLKQVENDVNWTSFEGYTPLMIACQKGHEEIVQLLLDNNANPNINNNYEESPLMFAARAKSLACVRMLLEAGACIDKKSYDGMTALHYAIFENCDTADIIQSLVDRGAKIDASDDWEITPFFKAAQFGFLKGLEIILERAKQTGLDSIIEIDAKDGATPVMIAAQNGAENCVQFLLQNNADCNKLTIDSVSALDLAIHGANAKCVQMIYEKMDGSSLKLCSLKYFENLSTSNQRDVITSPLHLSITSKRHDILKQVLKLGLDPNDLIGNTDDYLTFFHYRDLFVLSERSSTILNEYKPLFISPLGVASCYPDMEDLNTLLEAGAEINPTSDNVICPLLVAIIKGHTNIVEHLLVNGADPNCSGKLSVGIYPRLLLVSNVNPSILRLLLKSGLDIRQCFSNFSPMQSGNPSTGIPLLQRILTLQPCCVWDIIEKYLSSRFTHAYKTNMLCYLLTMPNGEEKEQLMSILNRPSNPKPLVHLARLKVRECVMYNGSRIFPLTKRLESLPCLPSLLTKYLSFES